MPVPTNISFNDAPDGYSFAEATTVNVAFTGLCRALWNPTAANSITVTMGNGDSVTFSSVPVGFLKVRCTRFTAATTATGIIACY